jgi:putative PEP-CTERM system TPR-repeat lipoprotein
VQLRNKIIVFLLFSNVALLSNAQLQGSNDDYENALRSFHEGEYDAAHIHIKNAIKQNPSHLSSKLLLGKVLLKNKETNTAIQSLTEALQLGVDKNLAYISLAEAYMLQRNYAKVTSMAIDELNRSNQYQLLIIQGNAWLHQQDNEQALEKFNQALKIKPNEERILEIIASFYIHQDKLNEANEFISKINTLHPKSSSALYLQAQILKKQKKNKEALPLLEQANRLKPNDRLIGRSLAQTYVTLNQISGARSIIDPLLIDTPDDPYLMLLNARLYSVTKENELANTAYEKLAQELSNIPPEILAELPELLYVSGLANYMSEHYELAAGLIQRYLAEDVDNLYAVTILADIYMKQDRTSSAIALMEKHYDLVTQDLIISVRLCNQYLINKASHKCNFLIDELEIIHGSHIATKLLKVKVLQAQNRYPDALQFFEQKISKKPTEASHKRIKSILHSQNKQHHEALDILNDLLTVNPANVDYMQLKTNELLALKQYQEAKTLNAQVLKLVPNNYRAKYIQAELLYLTQNYYQAQRAAEKLILSEPSSFLASLLLSNTLVAQKKLDEALEASIKAKGKSKDGSPKPSENIVRIYRLQGELENALTELEYLNKKFLLEPKYLLEKAELNLLLNNLDAARRNYNILYSRWSDEHQKLLILAQKQRLAGFYEDSERSLLRGLSLSPEFIYLKIELLRLLLTQNKVEQAEEIIAPLMKEYANNANVQLLAGDIALKKELPDKAQQHFLTALTLNNNYYQAITRLKKIATDYQIGNKKFEQALNTIVEKYPDETAFHRHTLADYLLEQGNEQAAKQHYLQIIKMETYPNLKYAFNNLANIVMATDPQMALSYIEKAIELDNTIAEFFDTKGWILASSEQLNQGLTYLRDAYTLDSENPTNWYHIGVTLHKLNRDKEALIELNKVLATEKDFPEKREAIKILKTF